MTSMAAMASEEVGVASVSIMTPVSLLLDVSVNSAGVDCRVCAGEADGERCGSDRRPAV